MSLPKRWDQKSENSDFGLEPEFAEAVVSVLFALGAAEGEQLATSPFLKLRIDCSTSFRRMSSNDRWNSPLAANLGRIVTQSTIGVFMIKPLIILASLAFISTVTFAQASAPEAASAPAKHKLTQKWKAAKARHPAASSTNPETSPDKKGGN